MMPRMSPAEKAGSAAEFAQPEAADRLQALRRLAAAGRPPKPPEEEVNNHIHTFYSFSPYSPTEAVWRSVQAGLTTAGIMDHDSISGAEEFNEAGGIAGLATTTGLECRCSFAGTSLEGRRLNNPDQLSVAYVALHGLPRNRIAEVRAWFRPLQARRNRRNRLMVARLNEATALPELALDFQRDVLPLSRWQEDGTVTERHILFALSLRLLEVAGRGTSLLGFLRE
jgi:hypothetical protein